MDFGTIPSNLTSVKMSPHAAAIQATAPPPGSPSDTLAGSGASSLVDEKKGARSYETTLEADEISIEALHVYDDEKLRDYYEPSKQYEGYHRWDPAATWTEKEESRIVQSIDLRIMSFACLLNFCLNLDRGNIGVAVSDNMLGDLGMNTNDYNNGQMIFYLAFLSAELPSQILSKKFGPDRWIPLQVMVWSLVTFCQAFNSGRASFFITRALLGLSEGGLIPDMVLYLSYWYKHSELTIRLSWFWACATVTSILGSLIGAGLLALRGHRGWAGWRYLFLVEGALTFSVGVFSVFYMPPSPTQTASRFRGKHGWFSARDETIMVNRVLRDDPQKAAMHNRQALSLQDFKDCLTDVDQWPLYILGLTSFVPFASPSAYLTLTLKSLGFSTFHTNLLTIPSSVLFIILVFSITYFSRRVDQRALVCLIPQIWGIALLAALITLPSHASPWVKFGITSLIVGHPYVHPIIVGWNSTNANSVRLRTVSASLYNMAVQMGSIISSQIYRQDDKASGYARGNRILISIAVYNFFLTLGVKFYFGWRNRQKKAQWKALDAEEKLQYAREVAPKIGNKSLLFKFKD